VDTKYFDKYEEVEPWIINEDVNNKISKLHDANFIGYTFKREIS
jgi:hypothetical protein